MTSAVSWTTRTGPARFRRRGERRRLGCDLDARRDLDPRFADAERVDVAAGHRAQGRRFLLSCVSDPVRVTDRLLDHLERLGLRLFDQLLLQGARGPPRRVDELEGLGLGVGTVLGCLRVRSLGDLSALRLRGRDLRVEGRDPLVHPRPLLVDGAAAGIQERAGGLGRRDRLGALPETSLPRGCEVGGLRLGRHRLGRQSLGRGHLRIGLDQARLGLRQARLRFGKAVVGLLCARIRLGEACVGLLRSRLHLRKPRLRPRRLGICLGQARLGLRRLQMGSGHPSIRLAQPLVGLSRSCLGLVERHLRRRDLPRGPRPLRLRPSGDVLGPSFGLPDQLTRAPLRVGHHLTGDHRRLLGQGLRTGEGGRHLRASLLHLVDEPGARPHCVPPQLGGVLLGGAADVAGGLLGVQEQPFTLLERLGDDVDRDPRGEVAGRAPVGGWLPGRELHAPMVHPNEVPTSHSSPGTGDGDSEARRRRGGGTRSSGGRGVQE